MADPSEYILVLKNWLKNASPYLNDPGVKSFCDTSISIEDIGWTPENWKTVFEKALRLKKEGEAVLYDWLDCYNHDDFMTFIDDCDTSISIEDIGRTPENWKTVFEKALRLKKEGEAVLYDWLDCYNHDDFMTFIDDCNAAARFAPPEAMLCVYPSISSAVLSNSQQQLAGAVGVAAGAATGAAGSVAAGAAAGSVAAGAAATNINSESGIGEIKGAVALLVDGSSKIIARKLKYLLKINALHAESDVLLKEAKRVNVVIAAQIADDTTQLEHLHKSIENLRTTYYEMEDLVASVSGSPSRDLVSEYDKRYKNMVIGNLESLEARADAIATHRQKLEESQKQLKNILRTVANV